MIIDRSLKNSVRKEMIKHDSEERESWRHFYDERLDVDNHGYILSIFEGFFSDGLVISRGIAQPIFQSLKVGFSPIAPFITAISMGSSSTESSIRCSFQLNESRQFL